MLRSAMVAALAVAAALAVPTAAAASPALDLRSPDARSSQSEGTPVAHDLRSPDARVPASPADEPLAVVRPEAKGFDWASAAIGVAAGTGFLLTVVAAIGLLGISGRRRDRIRPAS